MHSNKTEGGTLVSQINQICQRVWFSILKRNGLEDLAGARGRVIFALWQEDNIPIKNLVEKTSLDKATLTGVLDRMERDGLVIRTHSKEDRRTVIISRTKKDELYKNSIFQVSEEMNNIFYKGFSQVEMTALDDYLKRVLSNLKEIEQNNKRD
jgi:DNA-binding MarR family transcriptional regulator